MTVEEAMVKIEELAQQLPISIPAHMQLKNIINAVRQEHIQASIPVPKEPPPPPPPTDEKVTNIKDKKEQG